jgi:hypothetical protein
MNALLRGKIVITIAAIVAAEFLKFAFIHFVPQPLFADDCKRRESCAIGSFSTVVLA